MALKDVSFEIRAGERVALVGPNGAGKSTLLHILAALSLPSSGDCEIGGTRLDKRTAPAARRHVGLLFQDPDDQIFMPTVREDIAFGPSNYGLGEEETRHRVDEAMRATSVQDHADRVPHHLSIGEKKRVAIAGLLAMSPEILLLDEPTANLDPQGRRELMNVLRASEATMIIATHDLGVAFELADRVIVLKGGVLFDGDLRPLMRRRDIIAEARLELPSFAKLMESWSERTGANVPPPLTVEEALEVLAPRQSDRE
ncbi:MAG: energy-coupling factor ABC transporter ATP-binding protein [Methanomassiliicoccales archaeon]|nr:energy-coupling factor ABC transporter ATP-binding protein [Methanomassiliicoccales archaeon]